MTSPQGIQLTFRKPQGGELTAGQIMKESQWLNQFFIMSQLFVCQNLPFSHCHEKCSFFWMAPLILYVIAHSWNCQFYCWLYLADVSSQQLTLRIGTKVMQLFSRKNRKKHVFFKLVLKTTAITRPSPLIPASLGRGVHNKSITYSFKIKIKRASD